jgi:hypothetical protein
MVKFTIKVLLLICTLLFGLLIGIQQAEHGIFSINGTSADQKQSFHVKEVDHQHKEVAILGESFSTKEWVEKQEEWKERNPHNTFSYLGNKIGDTVYSISRMGAEWIAKMIDQFL